MKNNGELMVYVGLASIMIVCGLAWYFLLPVRAMTATVMVLLATHMWQNRCRWLPQSKLSAAYATTGMAVVSFAIACLAVVGAFHGIYLELRRGTPTWFMMVIIVVSAICVVVVEKLWRMAHDGSTEGQSRWEYIAPSDPDKTQPVERR